MAEWLRAVLAPDGPARRAGQSLVEYALIIALIAIAVIVAVAAMGGQIQNVFTRITGSLGGQRPRCRLPGRRRSASLSDLRRSISAVTRADPSSSRATSMVVSSAPAPRRSATRSCVGSAQRLVDGRP
jgi:Flp pilus assembly pilin Flp